MISRLCADSRADPYAREHPLAGRSSRHKDSRGEEFVFLSPVDSTRERLIVLVTRPVFNRSVSDWSAPVTRQETGVSTLYLLLKTIEFLSP